MTPPQPQPQIDAVVVRPPLRRRRPSNRRTRPPATTSSSPSSPSSSSSPTADLLADDLPPADLGAFDRVAGAVDRLLREASDALAAANPSPADLASDSDDSVVAQLDLTIASPASAILPRNPSPVRSSIAPSSWSTPSRPPATQSPKHAPIDAMCQHSDARRLIWSTGATDASIDTNTNTPILSNIHAGNENFNMVRTHLHRSNHAAPSPFSASKRRRHSPNDTFITHPPTSVPSDPDHQSHLNHIDLTTQLVHASSPGHLQNPTPTALLRNSYFQHRPASPRVVTATRYPAPTLANHQPQHHQAPKFMIDIIEMIIMLLHINATFFIIFSSSCWTIFMSLLAYAHNLAVTWLKDDPLDKRAWSLVVDRAPVQVYQFGIDEQAVFPCKECESINNGYRLPCNMCDDDDRSGFADVDRLVANQPMELDSNHCIHNTHAHRRPTCHHHYHHHCHQTGNSNTNNNLARHDTNHRATHSNLDDDHDDFLRYIQDLGSSAVAVAAEMAETAAFLSRPLRYQSVAGRTQATNHIEKTRDKATPHRSKRVKIQPDAKLTPSSLNIDNQWHDNGNNSNRNKRRCSNNEIVNDGVVTNREHAYLDDTITTGHRRIVYPQRRVSTGATFS